MTECSGDLSSCVAYLELLLSGVSVISAAALITGQDPLRAPRSPSPRQTRAPTSGDKAEGMIEKPESE